MPLFSREKQDVVKSNKKPECGCGETGGKKAKKRIVSSLGFFGNVDREKRR